MKLCRKFNLQLSSILNRTFSIKSNKPSIVDEYFQVKRQHPNSLVLYQIGDFYEAFGDDARTLSQLADIQLCKSDRQGFPMTGVPVRSIDVYAERVLNRGISLAIYDQLGLGENGKIRRIFNRMITPGSFWDEQSDECTRYILALSATEAIDSKEFMLSWGDISTGKLHWSFCKPDDLFRMFGIIAPVEVVLDKRLECMRERILKYFQNNIVVSLHELEDAVNDLDEQHLITDESKSVSTESTTSNQIMLYADRIDGERAVNLLFDYLEQHKICDSNVFEKAKYFNPNAILLLDASCLNALEIFSSYRSGDSNSSLFATLNRTVTLGGSRLLHHRLKYPSLSLDEIEFRLDMVDSFKALDSFLVDQFRQILKTVPDTERHLQRIVLNKSTGALQSLKKIQCMLQSCDELLRLIGQNEKEFEKNIFCFLTNGFFDFSPLLQSLSNSLVDEPPSRLDEGDFIKEGWDAELDQLRNEFQNSLSNLQLLQLQYRQETENFGLKIVTDKKTIGWFIESGQPIHNQGFCLESSSAKCHRYRTEKLNDAYRRHESLSLLIAERQLEIYKCLRETILGKSKEIKSLSAIVSEIDLAISMTFLSSYSRPHFIKPNNKDVATENNPLSANQMLPSNNEADTILIKGSFHPVVAANHTSQLKNFVTNDSSFSSPDFWLITGPNMGGKSTFLRQIAIISIMAQAGLPVPASYARLKPYDGIFCRIGASDDISKNQSTFMLEMQEMSDIFSRATSSSLILLDEVGRGTSYSDGISITLAICKYLLETTKGIVLFATHYHELPQHLPTQVKQYKSDAFVDEDGHLVFSYRIAPGHSDQSFGVEVAALAGFPTIIVEQAKRYRQTLFSSQRQ